MSGIWQWLFMLYVCGWFMSSLLVCMCTVYWGYIGLLWQNKIWRVRRWVYKDMCSIRICCFLLWCNIHVDEQSDDLLKRRDGPYSELIRRQTMYRTVGWMQWFLMYSILRHSLMYCDVQWLCSVWWSYRSCRNTSCAVLGPSWPMHNCWIIVTAKARVCNTVLGQRQRKHYIIRCTPVFVIL